MIGCIIQARMGSSRLPGKVMEKLDQNNTVLSYVIKQLKYSKLLDDIIVATTSLKRDEVIVDFLEEEGIKYFCGDEENVLDRYYQCAKKFSMSEIVRIPSDKPLIDPEIVDKCIEVFLTKKYDYVTTFLEPSFPYGTEVEVFSFNVLEKVWKNAQLPSEHENVTPYIYNNKDKFQIYNLKNSIDLSHLRWVIDRAEDLELVRQLVSKINKEPILMQDILEIFKSEPKLAEINSNVKHDEGYKKSLKKDLGFIKRGKTFDEK
jgi:spore coat polysaccharide biosynthesis protein SpsF